MPKPLEDFEGNPVIASEVRITKAGDGLSDELAVDPMAFAIGERVVYIVEVDTADVIHRRVSAASRDRKRIHAQPVMRIVRSDDPQVLRVLEAEDARVRESVAARNAREAEAEAAARDAERGEQRALEPSDVDDDGEELSDAWAGERAGEVPAGV